jgi:hypothetical protein
MSHLLVLHSEAPASRKRLLSRQSSFSAWRNMTPALKPSSSPRVNELERKAHKILHRIDRLNVELGAVLHEIFP